MNKYSIKECSAEEEGQKTKRMTQKEERNEAILAEALDLFIRRGYAGTRIADIAGAVGMSVGLLFHYYPSKEKLYEELVRIGIAGVESVWKIDTSDVPAFFLKCVTYIFAEIKKNDFVAKMFVFMAQAERTEALPESAMELMKKVSAVSSSVPLIERAQAEGIFRAGNPIALSLAFWCCIQGIAEEIAIHPELACPEPEWVLGLLLKQGE